MNEQIEIYINKLKNFSEVSIADTEWTAEFEQAFRTELKQQGIDEIRIYRTLQQPDRRLICRVFHKPSIEVEQEYNARSMLGVLLPIIILILLYFLLISLIALRQEAMLTTAFLIFLPFSFGALVEYLTTLNRPHSIAKVLLQQLWVLLAIIVVGGVILREGVIC